MLWSTSVTEQGRIGAIQSLQRVGAAEGRDHVHFRTHGPKTRAEFLRMFDPRR